MKEKLVPKEQIPKELLIYSNIAFLMADVANTMLSNSLDECRKYGKDFKQDSKLRWNRMNQAIYQAKRATADFSRELYQLPDAATAADDSDYFADICLLIADRCGDNNERQEMVRNMLLRLRSEIKVYEKFSDRIKHGQ